MPDKATFDAFLTADTITKVLIIIMLLILAAIVIGPRLLTLLGRKQDVDDKKAMAEIEARAAEREERKTQTQAIYALIAEIGKSNSVLTAMAANQNEQFHNNAELIQTLQTWQVQEDKRIEMRKADLDEEKRIRKEDMKNNAENIQNIAEQIKGYVRGVSELSGTLHDTLGAVASDNRRFYAEALNLKMDEASTIDQKHYDDLKSALNELHSKFEQLQQDILAIRAATDKIEELTKKPEPVIPPPIPEASPMPPTAAQ